MKRYITVEGVSSAEYEEKRSRFIAAVYPCDSEQRAGELIAAARSKYWDARHNCYAYVLRDGTARFSDDSEPHGTAGKPILDVINGSGAVDVMIIVTRYFGGVLLGTGGLVRAYSTSARDAMLAVSLVEMCPCTDISVVCPYSDYERLQKLIENCGGTVTDTVYTDKIEIFCSFKTDGCENFENILCETFSSRLKAVKMGENYCGFPINRE